MPLVRAELAGEVAAGKVVLHGWLDGDKAIEVMRRSEVFLLASAFEGFCIALTESMANGCTPVVTDIKSGNKQLVEDGLNGFVVPVGDAAALADRINVLAADRGRLLEFRKRAWETGRQYSVDRMVDAYEDCFERAVADARANPRRPDPDFPLMPSCRSKYPLWLRRVKAKIAGR
jgi:glycosyltransferase involved in cell wall biosynthesis